MGLRTQKRRRRESRTDYKARRILLTSGVPRIVVRRTNKYFILQAVESIGAQDKVLATVTSKELLENGWDKKKAGSLKSIAAGYLTGILMAKKLGKGKYIMDLGMARTEKGGRVFAVVAGLIEGGLDIPADKKVFPSEERLVGEHAGLKDMVEKVKGGLNKMVEEEKKEMKPEEQLKEMEKVMEEKKKEEEKEVSKEFDKTAKVEEGRGGFKRESFEDKIAREEREKLDNWVPKTELGRAVRAGKVKDIDVVLGEGRKIMEPEIVDLLLPGLKKDTLFIGQAKGKFGGGKRRPFRQTQKKTKEGNVLTFGVMAVVGDGKGHVGIGYGRAAETLPAKEKAFRKAKLNISKIKLGCASFDCSCDEHHSIPVAVRGKCSSVVIQLMPAPQGTGLVVNDELKKILKLAGVKDVYSKTSGKVRTTFNSAKACMAALQKIGEVRI